MTVKRWKRAAAALLAGIFLIGAAACGTAEKETVSGDKAASGSADAKGDAAEPQNEETVKGRYMETQKETPEGVNRIEKMVRLADGRIAFIDPDTGDFYTSEDTGDTWESRPLPAMAPFLGIEEIEITSTAIAPDGGVFFSYISWKEDNLDEDGVNEHYIYIDKDGNDAEIPLESADGYKTYLSNADFTGEKTLVGAMNGGSIYQIDLEAGTLNTLRDLTDDLDALDSPFAAGDYLLTSEVIYQISTASAVEDTALQEFIAKETTGYRNVAFCLDSAENTIYAASASGLYSHVMGGSTMENLLDGGLCNLGDPSKYPTALLKNEDGSFLIAFEDGEIDLYAYDPEAPAVPTQQLTVYSLEQNMTVSKAVSLFRKQYPDVYVKQEIGLDGDYGVTKEDAIHNLNTRLLAGEGPDIILLDGMPIDSYIEKNVLTDLSGLADQLEKDSSYFSNILRSYQQENGLYAVPTRVQIPIVVGIKELAEGISGMDGFAGAVKKGREAYPNAETVLGAYTAEELLERLYMLGSSELMKDGKLDEAAMRSFLEKAAEIYEAERQNITDSMLQAHESSKVWREDAGMMDSYNNFSVTSGNMFELLSNTQPFMVCKMREMTDFEMAEGMPDNRDALAYDLMKVQSGTVFVPYGIAGINANTKETELAEAFLSALLDEEVQKSDLSDGFPVNADAYDKFTQTSNPESTIGFSVSMASADGGDATEPLHFQASWPTAEEIAALKDKIGKLSVPALSDEVIHTAVLEGAIRVLEGERTVDEGCDEIVQKIQLYLAE